MARYGYGYVTEKAFSAFTRDLGEGAWKEVSIKKYDVEDRVPLASLMDAPRPVVWKLRAAWCIADLDAALGVASAEQLATLDTEWDGAERAFHFFLASEAEHKDPARREAAGRLRGALLAGSGTEQVNYGYDAEVDFGRHQVSIARKAPLSADVELVGAEAHVERIDEATEALAKALGRGPGQRRTAARSKRLREAMAACTTTFNALHDEMSFQIEHTRPGKQRDQLHALHAPFLALLERNPPRTMPVVQGQGEPTEPQAEPAAQPS